MNLSKDFPMLSQLMQGKNFIYLDTAATAQKPQCVIDTISNFYRNEYATVHRSVYEHAAKTSEKYTAVRRKVATYLSASSEEEIVFTRGATDGINLVARSLGDLVVSEGDEILVTALEHHSNLVPWQMLAQRKKAKLIIAPIDSFGDVDLEAFEKLLSDKTRIVSFTHISNAIGTVNPIEEMVKIARRYEVYILVDGAQGAPHLPINVVESDVDFYVFSGHKLYGPTGVGVLYGKKEILEMMPPLEGGGDMVDQVSFESATYQLSPLKFEAGTPMIASVLGLGAAIDYISSFELVKRVEYEEELLSYTIERLHEIPTISILGNPKKRAALVSFNIEGVHPLDLGNILDFKGVAIRTGSFCAQPLLRHFGLNGAARISLGLYNTKNEIDFAISALSETAEILLSI
jgi:cysteine desulfurase/selenocysteine lyase